MIWPKLPVPAERADHDHRVAVAVARVGDSVGGLSAKGEEWDDAEDGDCGDDEGRAKIPGWLRHEALYETPPAAVSRQPG